MDPTAIATIIVAVVASLSAYLAQRESSKANKQIEAMKVEAKKDMVTSDSRSDMERDAYLRARRFDMETIARQSEEIDDLRKRVTELETEVDSLRTQLRAKDSK